MSLSNCNETGYIKRKKKKSLFLSARIHGSQTLLSHALVKNYDRNYSLYEGEATLTPFFARSSKRTWPKKRTMQPSQLFPDANQNSTVQKAGSHGGAVYSHCSPRPKAPASNTPILPLNAICLNPKSKLPMICYGQKLSYQRWKAFEDRKETKEKHFKDSSDLTPFKNKCKRDF